MVDAVHAAADRVADVLAEAAEQSPGDEGRVRFGLQAMRLGDRDLWQGGYSEGQPTGARADVIPLLTAAREVFAASFDAGEPLRRLDVELRRVDGGWVRHAGVETVTAYRAFRASWEPWQQLCGVVVAEAADAACPGGWEYAQVTRGRLSVRRPAAGPEPQIESADAPPAAATLWTAIGDAFAESGRRLVRLEAHAISDGRSAATWNYRLDVERPGGTAVLAPPVPRTPGRARRAPSGPPPPTVADRAPRADPGEHWDRLLAAVTGLAGGGWLRPPAPAADLARLETAPGHPVPEALRAGWLRHDGQEPADETGRFFGLRWLSIGEIFSRGTFEGRTDTGDDVDDENPEDTGSAEALAARRVWSAPPGAVRLWRKHPGWLPVFRRSMAGAYLAVDLAPGPAGRPGQAIACRFDGPERVVVARDFHALLAWMAAEATAGRLVFHDGEDEEHPDDHDHLAEDCYLTHADDPYGDLVSTLLTWCTTGSPPGP